MTLTDIIVLTLVLGYCAFIVIHRRRKARRAAAEGGCSGCCAGCSGCSGGCGGASLDRLWSEKRS